MRRSRGLVALAALYGAGLAAVGLWPQHVDSNYDIVSSPFGVWLGETLGTTPPDTYRVIETTSNVLMFMPLGALTLMLWPRLRWIGAVAVGLVITGTIEIAQAVALAGRTASVSDILANTAGAALGASIVVGAVTRSRRAERRPARRG